MNFTRHLSLIAMLLTAATVRAELIRVASMEEMASGADSVVLGDLDAGTGSIDVEIDLAGRLPPGEIRVGNLDDAPGDHSPYVTEHEPTGRVLLFLRTLDGRHFLVDTGSPGWLPPHSALKYVTDEGRLLGYHQQLSGTLGLFPESLSLEELKAKLPSWLPGNASDRRPPSLQPEQAERLYGNIEPWVALHAHRLVSEPSDHELATILAALEELAGEDDRLLHQRVAEAMLVLSKQFGPEQRRRQKCEDALERFAAVATREAVEDALLLELASPDVRSSKRSAARVAARLGGKVRVAALEILVELVRERTGTLQTDAYFGLVVMGEQAVADDALSAGR